MRHLKFRIIILSLAFIGIIFFPIINKKLNILKDSANLENRRMESKPVLSLKRIDSLPTAYEKYYNDQFSLRARLIKYYNVFNLLVYKKSPFPDKVIIGNDGWLYLPGEEMDSYLGSNNLTKTELLEYKTELEYRQKYLRDRGCEFYFMITPSKPTIYPEYLPINEHNLNDKSIGEELIDYLDKYTTVKPINIYEVLKKNKKNYHMYYKLDNHWTNIGAFFGSNEVLSKIHVDFPKVKPWQLTSFTVKQTEINSGNTVAILGNLNLFKDVDYEVKPKHSYKSIFSQKANYEPAKNFPYKYIYEVVKEVKGSENPSLLIISDSFGDYALPFLADNFKKTVRIWDNWEYKLNEDIVNKEKPEVLLLMIHEKNLRYLLKHNSAKNNEVK